MTYIDVLNLDFMSIINYLKPPKVTKPVKLTHLPLHPRDLKLLEDNFNNLTESELDIWFDEISLDLEKWKRFDDYDEYTDYNPTNYCFTELTSFQNKNSQFCDGFVPSWSKSKAKFLKANIQSRELLDLKVHNKFFKKSCWIAGFWSGAYPKTRNHSFTQLFNNSSKDRQHRMIYNPFCLYELGNRHIYDVIWNEVEEIVLLGRLNYKQKKLHYKRRLSDHKEWQYRRVHLRNKSL